MFDTGLHDTHRKVRAVALLHPDAEPSNPVARGIEPLGPNPTADQVKEHGRLTQEVEDLMALQRALFRGEGLWEWMNAGAEDIGSRMAVMPLAGSKLRQPPSLNFLDIDAGLAGAIVAQALPEDRERFRRYMSKVFCGIGVITAVSCPGLHSNPNLSDD